MESQLKGTKKVNSDSSAYNALEYMINSLINGINTAALVRVDSVSGGGAASQSGHVAVTPLVCQIDGDNNVIQPVSIPGIPFFRLNGGGASLVCDPKPGDIGIAVFCKRDSSNVINGTIAPVQPGSFRNFSEADGVYIGSILSSAPSVYVSLDVDSGEIVLKAPSKIRIDAGTCEINCPIIQTGENGTGATLMGQVSTTGGIAAQGDITAGSISASHHTHPNGEGGTTGEPNG